MTARALRQVLTLLGGAGVAQAVALGASPLLSRIYAPADFAAPAIFFSAVTFLATAATGRFEAAVILPSDDSDAWQLVWLALWFILPMVALTALTLVVFGEQLARLAAPGALAFWQWLLPVTVFLTAVLAVLTAWANRRQDYAALARNRVVQAIAAAGCSIWLGVEGLGSLGLMLGSVLALGIGSAILARAIWSAAPSKASPDAAAMRMLATRYRDFPRINLIHALLDAAQTSLVLILLGGAYGVVALGAYVFAMRIVRTPLAMVGSSVGQVFQQRAAKLANIRGDVAELSRRTTQKLMLIALPFAVLMPFAPTIFEWVFGPEWREAGECALALAPWLLFSFITSPRSQLPLIYAQQRRAFVFGVAYQLALVLPLALAWALEWPLLLALCVHSAAASVVLLFYARWLNQLAEGAR